MKKNLFQVAIAAVAMCVMVACTGNAEKPVAGENADSTEVKAGEAETAEPTIESRGMYTVAVPAGWTVNQYASNMLLTKGDVVLDVKEWNGTEVSAKSLENLGCKPENKLDDIVAGKNTWVGYKDAKDFKKVYLTALSSGDVVRIGSNDADVDMKPILEGVVSNKDKE